MAKFCTNCGAQLPDDAKFCTSCGKQMEAPVPAAPVAAPKRADPVPAPAYEVPAPNTAADKPDKKSKVKASKTEKCSNCGAPLRAGNGFCTQCGAPRGAVAKNRRVVIGKDGRAVLKRRRHPKRLIAALLILAILFTGVIMPGWALNLFYRPGKALGAERIEVETTTNGQVVAKGMATDGFGLPLSIRYTDADRASAPALSAEVSPENPVAYFDNGIIVDFGDNLTILDEADESAELDEGPRIFTLRTLPPKEDEAHGCRVTGWDFDLGDIHEFPMPVKVTVPYRADVDPNTLVPQHYNEAYGCWEYSAYEIDTEHRTITFYLRHFSDEALAEYPAQPAGGSGGALNMITIQLMPEQIEAAFAGSEGAEEYVNALLARNKASTLEWIYQASGKTGNVVTGTDLGIGLKDLMRANGTLLSGVDIGLNVTGIMLAGIRVYRDFLRTESFDQAVSRNKTDLLGAAVSAAGIANTAAVYYTGAGLFVASGPILLGAGALVFGFSYLDGKIKDFAFQGSDSYLAHAYETFTEDRMLYIPSNRSLDWRLTTEDYNNAAAYAGGNYSKLNDKYFDRLYKAYKLSTGKGKQAAYISMMNQIKKDYPGEPDRWVSIFDDRITAIANYFFNNLSEDERVMLSRIYNRGNDDWWNTQAEINNMKADMVKKLRYELNENGSFYKNFMEESYVAMKEQVYSALGVQQDYLNQVLYFDLDMKNSKGKSISLDDSSYKGCYIVFDLSGCNPALRGSEPWAVDMSSTGEIFHCTLGSWLLAGQPRQLLVYDSYRDYVTKEAPVKVIPVPEVAAKANTVSSGDSGNARINRRLPGNAQRPPIIIDTDEDDAAHGGASTTIISITNDIPTLEELVGTYENGRLTIEEVNVSPALNEALNEYGCEPYEMVGTSTELAFTIAKADKDLAVISVIPSEDQKEFLFDNSPISYDPDKGIMKAKIIVEDTPITVKLECTYTDANKTGVMVTGSFLLKAEELKNLLSVGYRVTGTKPTALNDVREGP